MFTGTCSYSTHFRRYIGLIKKYSRRWKQISLILIHMSSVYTKNANQTAILLTVIEKDAVVTELRDIRYPSVSCVYCNDMGKAIYGTIFLYIYYITGKMSKHFSHLAN